MHHFARSWQYRKRRSSTWLYIPSACERSADGLIRMCRVKVCFCFSCPSWCAVVHPCISGFKWPVCVCLVDHPSGLTHRDSRISGVDSLACIEKSMSWLLDVLWWRGSWERWNKGLRVYSLLCICGSPPQYHRGLPHINFLYLDLCVLSLSLSLSLTPKRSISFVLMKY